MGRYIKQQETRSELQQRLAADLRAKAAERRNQEGDNPNQITESSYYEGSKQTSSLAWVWILVGFAAFIIFCVLAYMAFSTTVQV